MGLEPVKLWEVMLYKKLFWYENHRQRHYLQMNNECNTLLLELLFYHLELQEIKIGLFEGLFQLI